MIGLRRRVARVCFIAGSLMLAVISAAGVARPQSPEPVTPPTVNWPSFRGPGASGVATGPELPTTFDAATGAGLAWRTAIPGLAHASPIVWGDRVFVTSAVSEGPPQRFLAELPDSREEITDPTPHSWLVMALDKHSGEVLWQRVAATGVPRTGRLRKGSFNNSTPATDGTHVVAWFGSRGLFCYDTEGNRLWQVDLGTTEAGWFFDPASQWGTASSPIIHDGRVIVQVDVRGGAFIAAFDVEDGSELWRAPRDEVSSWATPTVVETSTRAEVVTSGGRAIRAYDAESGEQLWSLAPSSEIAAPTPIFAGGLIFVGAGYLPTQPFYAVAPGGSGDISLPEGSSRSRQIAWSTADGGPLLSTPVVVGNFIFLLSRDGTLSCFDAGSGLPMFRQKIVADEEPVAADPADPAAPAPPAKPPLTFTASPVAADGKLYIASDQGDVYVVEAGPILRLAATNPIGEAVFATPAISDGMLLIRGQNHLFAFSQ